MTVVTTCCLASYPLAITAIAQVAFPTGQRQLSRARHVDRVAHHRAGFSSPGYFRRGRRQRHGYDAANSAGTQLGPTNKKLIDAVTANVEAARRRIPTRRCRSIW
jgi:K+-transporting ATPase ATPase C chain